MNPQPEVVENLRMLSKIIWSPNVSVLCIQENGRVGFIHSEGSQEVTETLHSETYPYLRNIIWIKGTERYPMTERKGWGAQLPGLRMQCASYKTGECIVIKSLPRWPGQTEA